MNDQTAYIEEQRFRKRQVIFREGDPGSCMYEVAEGRVGIFSDYGKPTEKLLT
ncbi:MAG: cyclic nucleotide-binding domain-containing protein [Ruminococcaceae bacterium]|nr:cyclic nucleotide-binding domain-containing protein [Oscillospiraceae bacterium]